MCLYGPLHIPGNCPPMNPQKPPYLPAIDLPGAGLGVSPETTAPAAKREPEHQTTFGKFLSVRGLGLVVVGIRVSVNKTFIRDGQYLVPDEESWHPGTHVCIPIAHVSRWEKRLQPPGGGDVHIGTLVHLKDGAKELLACDVGEWEDMWGLYGPLGA